MLYNEALRILGLKPDFTEEELKKVHRKLSNLYHPDINSSPEASEKMKEINTARDCLLDALKKGQSSSYSSNNPWNKNTGSYNTNFNIREYKDEKIKQIETITDCSLLFKKYPNAIDYNAYWDDIIFFASDFDVFTINANKQTIDNEFIKFLNMLQKKYKQIRTEFCKKYNIDENDVVERINRDCTFLEFYEYLLKIKEIYSKESLIKKKLEDETEKYKTYTGYDKIYMLINTCINNALIKIKNNDFVYSQKDIEDMHRQILEIFKVYYSLKQKIEEVDGIIANIDDINVRNEYETLKRNFERGSAFSDIEKSINELEIMLDKYNKNIIFKKNDEKINQIYQSLITKYYDVVKKYNIVTEQSKINSILLLLNKLNELFNKGCLTFKDLDYFNLFNEITFVDIENDNKIIELITIKLELSREKNNKSNVYINVRGENRFDYKKFYYLDEERKKVYVVDYSDEGTYCKSYLYEKEFPPFDDKFMLLEEFLDKGNFKGEKRKNFNDNVYILLYRMHYHDLCMKDNEFFIEYSSMSYPVDKKEDFNFDEFKNKKHVIELIRKQIEQTIKEEEKNVDFSNSSNDYDFMHDGPQYNTDDGVGRRGR